MKSLIFILNLPWTILGLLQAMVSFPSKLFIHNKPFALVFNVRSFWWLTWMRSMKRVRATTMGNVVLLGANTLENDFEHELVHVQQFENEPLIMPFLYLRQNILYGLRKNKYEDEAYTTTNSIYLGQ